MLHQRTTFEEAKVSDTGDGKLLQGKILSYGGPANANGYVHAPGDAQASVESLPREGFPMPMLYEHEYAIGKWLEMTDSRSGVRAKGRPSKTQRADEVVTLVEDAAINGVSAGFEANWEEVHILGPGEDISLDTPYGPWKYQAKGWEIVFAEIQLFEASITATPAEPDNRLKQKVWERASTAMPGLRQSAAWEEVAYSMALLMGGRGAGQAFEDVAGDERLSMYVKLAEGYKRLGKEPPLFEERPEYKQVAFRHDERLVFQDRYLRKSLASVESGIGGYEGPLSPTTREQAELVHERLSGLLERKGVTDELDALAARLSGLSDNLKGATG